MSKTHTVKRGETIVQIAQQNGFRSWQPIWGHANNSKLRSVRPNAYVLSKDDQVFIPEKKLVDYSCQTNLKHVFRVRNMKQYLRQVILDQNDQPLPGKSFELKVGGQTIKDKTDGAGVVDKEIPIDAKTAELKVWLKDGDDSSCLTWTLQLGHLEPVENIYGLKSHLTNLGYDCGEVNETFDQKTKEALMEFQSDHDLPPTGQNDSATQNKLLSLHDYPLEGSH